jgi:nicotinamide-nucleotide amidase
VPSVEIIAVGTELLLGRLVDTNTPFIARHLADNGIDVYGTQVVGDNRARIGAAIAIALSRSDGVVTTGGLGPTVDDLTKEGVCEALEVTCERDQASVERMRAIFAAFGRPMRENNLKQADLPRGSAVLVNANGTAPGFIVEAPAGKFVACLPGVPHEMRAMLVDELVPRLRDRFRTGERIVTRVLRVTGLGESEIDSRIVDLFHSGENPKLALLAHIGSCDVTIMAKARDETAAQALIAPIERQIRERLTGHIYGSNDDSLAGAVLAALRERRWTLATAESCTGGRIAAAITAVPGASQQFAGGVVAYADAAKIALLGVDRESLASYGAVSLETSAAMASGARRRFGVDVAIATTGVAGPSGGSTEKPVGLVWLAMEWPGGARAIPVTFPGDREAIQTRATQASLALLWSVLHLR